MIVKTVGRGQDNNIVINDEKVSRTHLQMVQDDNGNISLVDVGSTNGTYVNGNRIVGETRLKPGDEVRIGNTELPWQEYFRSVQTLPPLMPSMPPKTDPPRNRKWLFIAGATLLILLIAGGILLVVNNKKKSEKERIELEQEKEQYNNLERNILDAEKEVAKAEAELQKAQKRALETTSAREKAILDSTVREKARNLEEARTRYKELEAEKNKQEEELKKKNDTLRATKAELDTARRAQQDSATAAQQARLRASKAKAEADSLRRQKTLTDEFYKQLIEAQSNNKLYEVCEELGSKEFPKTRMESEGQADAAMDRKRRDYIVGQFANHTDTTARKDMIKKIKKVLNQ